jgi:ComF family protein
MLLLEKIISVIAPHRCVGCESENDRLLCESCRLSLPNVPSRCYRCRSVTDDFVVCKACRRGSPLCQVVVFTYHQGLAKELVHRMKYERARQGVLEMAEAMTSLVELFDDDVVLVHVPTATSRVRARGYDHARLLARELGRRNNLPTTTLLARVGQAHQVGSSRAQRLEQLEGAFRVLKPQYVRGRHVVLVDDVLTSGATLETAARMLKRAEAERVSALVFAQAQ